ncbi:hypothetical protein CONPUDRAFT_145753 [Coniophora puteana RWD-64-598 SS2]|uniref:CST complex subunit STN1 n=1 Tax=Coniophora puteana (strain RWD-64-598) TaxID=741705 RepID=A0A5M3MI22_CONPW|nr:uncharacterized protein CONPUDRAFT_145753 [Coniophora puteana RWD-64-598 SS2]EIW78580.1 hypothetical protein CONPUDRAFT_145753 [Coniophora puteana RWD-64-598 SS2]
MEQPSGSKASVHTPQELYAWTFHKDAVAPCFVKDVFAMTASGIKDADFFWLGYTPCRSVHIAGMVVGVQVYEKRTVYTVDDGTAVIDCTLRHAVVKPPPPPSKTRPPASISRRTDDAPSPPKKRKVESSMVAGPPGPPEPIADVGALVEVVGRVAARYETKEVVVDRLEHCESANAEIRHWARVIDIHRAKYSQAVPFVIPTHPPTSRASNASPVRSYVAGPSNDSGPSTLPETPRKRRNIADHPLPSVNGRNRRAVSPASSTVDGSEASSAPSSPAKSPTHPQIIKLRHPSRLHSRDLTSNTFRIYLKHYMDNVPILAAAAAMTSMNRFDNNGGDYRDEVTSIHDTLTTPTKKRPFSKTHPLDTPRLSRFHDIGEANTTPTPTQKSKGKQKEQAPNGVDISEEDDTSTPFGFTLSHLRRVPELALLAGRVVRAETRRRAREAREKEKAAAHSQFSQQASNPYMLSAAAASASGSASSSAAKGRSVKVDKGKEGEKKKKEDPPRVKKRRLFVWALVRLYEEGAIVLWDAEAPKRAPPAPWSFSAIKNSSASALSNDHGNDDGGAENGVGETSALWKSTSGNTSVFSSASGSTASTSASASRLPEDDEDEGALSDPRADEEIYVILTPALLAREISAVLSARRARGRGADGQKASAEEVRKILARDSRWARVGIWAIEEAMTLL